MSNKDANDIIKLVESLQNSDLLVDGAIEAVKNEIKKEDEFLGALMVSVTASLIAPIASSLIQPVASSLRNSITGKIQSGQKVIFTVISITLMMKVLEKGVTRVRKDYNNMNNIKAVNPAPSFKQFWDYLVFQLWN